MRSINSTYPPKRSRKHDDGTEEGVIGSVAALQNTTLSDQPVPTLDWNTDKVGRRELYSYKRLICYSVT